MSARELLSRLDKVKPKGRGSWVACCPAHEDSDPSLVITQADNGNILIHCFAGCSPGEILDAVGLELSALFSDSFLKQHRQVIDLERRSKVIQSKQAAPTPLGKEQTILAITADMRARGEKLSEKDLEREFQAYLRTRGKQ